MLSSISFDAFVLVPSATCTPARQVLSSDERLEFARTGSAHYLPLMERRRSALRVRASAATSYIHKIRRSNRPEVRLGN